MLKPVDVGLFIKIKESKVLIFQCYCLSFLFSLSFSKIYLLFFQAAMAIAANPISY